MAFFAGLSTVLNLTIVVKSLVSWYHRLLAVFYLYSFIDLRLVPINNYIFIYYSSVIHYTIQVNN